MVWLVVGVDLKDGDGGRVVSGGKGESRALVGVDEGWCKEIKKKPTFS